MLYNLIKREVSAPRAPSEQNQLTILYFNLTFQ